MNAQDLKNSILQLAIQGKLVEQREEEGSAKKLLEKIEAKKKHLIKEGKIKKQKELSEIKEDEIPFDIPESWEWARLNDVFNFIDYRGKTPTKITSGIVLITASNIKKGYLDFSKADFISETDYNERQSRGITKKGDILFTTEAPLGNVAINTLNIASAGQRAITFQQYGENIFLNELICYFIQSPHFQFELINNATGTTAKGIKAARLKGLMIPFPPLEEQKRIVAKIEELMPYVDKYDVAYSEVQELNKTFPEDMQKSILQYAVKGKLVEQREEDGTAVDLYKQIQEEKKKLIKEGKIKKTKALPEITEDEIPFDIPENWKWVRLGDVTHNWGQKKPDKLFDYIDVGSVDNIRGALSKKENLIEPNSAPSRARKIVKEGSVLYSTIRPYLLNICINNKTFKHEPIASTAFAILHPFEGLSNKYLYHVLKSPMFTSYVNIVMKGVAYPAINDKNLLSGLIPLPPVAEQERITDMIERLLPYSEQMIQSNRDLTVAAL